MSRDRYLDALEQIEKRQKDQISVFRDQNDRFSEFVSGLYGEKLTENEYLRLLQMFYQRACSEEEYQMKPGSRQKARSFCIAQMKRLEKSRKSSRLRRFYPFLMPSDEKRPELEKFVSDLPDSYSPVESRITNRFLWIITLSALLILGLLVLLLKLPFYPVFFLVVAAAAALVVYVVQVVSPAMADEQIMALQGSLEELQQGLEAALPGEVQKSTKPGKKA